MNPIKNPFSPGAGSPPPELVGRDAILEQARILLGRTKHRRPEKSILLTGLRGVGKTVLLGEIARTAKSEEFHTVFIEAHEDKSLGRLLAPELRALLFELDRMAGAGDKARRGLAVLRSFINTIQITVHDVSIGLDIEPAEGTADTGDIEFDLPSLLIAVAEAALERKTVVAIIIDEVQYLDSKELGALIMAMHKMQQLQLPLILLGAGLPILPALAGESKSYAERLFNFPEVGALSEAEVKSALQEPAQEAGAHFQNKALKKIFDQTKGYPYFVQEWGYQSWNHASRTTVTLDTVNEASETVIARLDQNFFRVRFDRLTPGEKNFLRAMSSLGSGSYRTSDIANALGVKVTALGPMRARLIKKGMI